MSFEQILTPIKMLYFKKKSVMRNDSSEKFWFCFVTDGKIYAYPL